MRSAVMASCLGCVALGLAPWIGVRAGVIAVMGLFLLPALPIVLAAAERLAGPAAGTAGAIVWMAGNLGGLVVALMVQILVHHPAGGVSGDGGGVAARASPRRPPRRRRPGAEDQGAQPAPAVAG